MSAIELGLALFLASIVGLREVGLIILFNVVLVKIIVTFVDRVTEGKQK